MFKYISLLFFVAGILGMIFSLSGFVYLDATMSNLFIICMGFMMTTSMTIAASIDLFKSKRN